MLNITIQKLFLRYLFNRNDPSRYMHDLIDEIAYNKTWSGHFHRQPNYTKSLARKVVIQKKVRNPVGETIARNKLNANPPVYPDNPVGRFDFHHPRTRNFRNQFLVQR